MAEIESERNKTQKLVDNLKDLQTNFKAKKPGHNRCRSDLTMTKSVSEKVPTRKTELQMKREEPLDMIPEKQ